MTLKLCHVAIVTPGRAGLYESTRELVAAERALDFDARLYDPKPTPFYPTTPEDRGALLAGCAFVDEADVIVDHSGCDGTTDALKTPHILVAHGRPRHSFISEATGGPPIYSYHYRLDKEEKYKAVVTFWPEHVGHLSVMFRKTPVYCVPPSVDLKAWHPDGPKGYEFHGKAGAFNVVITDAWRDDVDPYDVLHAAALAARRIPGMKVHVYGRQGEHTKGWDAILKVMQEDGTLGEFNGWVKGLDNVYRAADLMVTPHTIYTRSIREAMACGCPVLSGREIDARNVTAFSTAIQTMLLYPQERGFYRKRAEALFNPIETARAFLAVVEKVA